MRHNLVLFNALLLQDFNPRTSCEVRLIRKEKYDGYCKFQSTHLVWGATFYAHKDWQKGNISIHAPRVRCDILEEVALQEYIHFNPRTSCEVRLSLTVSGEKSCLFQSTHLVWGATTSKCTEKTRKETYFNPRTSCEVRHRRHNRGSNTSSISIHAPRVRCDTFLSFYLPPVKKFQSTHLVWGATAVSIVFFLSYKYFNPRTSCEVRP